MITLLVCETLFVGGGPDVYITSCDTFKIVNIICIYIYWPVYGSFSSRKFSSQAAIHYEQVGTL